MIENLSRDTNSFLEEQSLPNIVNNSKSYQSQYQKSSM